MTTRIGPRTDSPVTFNQTVIVASNATLTIDPGVTVNMGMYSLTVYGTLIAKGLWETKFYLVAVFPSLTS